MEQSPLCVYSQPGGTECVFDRIDVDQNLLLVFPSIPQSRSSQFHGAWQKASHFVYLFRKNDGPTAINRC